MFSTLLSTRRFAPIFWCQFLSALNDNLVKTALVTLILFPIAALSIEGAGGTASPLVPLAGAVLILPFFLLSGLGGELADRYDKGVVAERLKLFEIPLAVLAGAGFVLHSIPILFVALAGYGVIGALFGPIKYGILPVHLAKEELPAGNALVEGATFLAILIGTIVGGLAVPANGTAWPLAVAAVGIAILCWLAARFVPRTGSAAPDLAINRNILASTVGLLRDLKADRRLWIGGLVTSWFWALGAMVLALQPVLMKTGFGAGARVVTLGLATFTIGIALGSILAARASKRRPNMALVPIGALLMGLFCLDLSWLAGSLAPRHDGATIAAFLATFAGWRVLIDFFGLAVAGGLYIVPSFAAVQSWAAEDRRARVIAGCNVLQSAAMAAGGIGLAVLQAMGIGLGTLFLALGLANLAVMGLVLMAWGREGVRDLGLFLFKIFLGLEVKGFENLPEAGQRAIIAPNHVSLLDAAVMHAIMPSHASFAIDTGMANTWWVRPFLRLVKAHAIDPTKPLGTRHLIQSVRSGETLVIFPEGRLTTTGGLMKVYDGTAMIADKADAVVVPVRIDGLERSTFGYLSKRQTRKALFPRTVVTILPPVRLAVDPALKGKSRRQAAGAKLQDIMVDAAVLTANLDQTLFAALVEARATRDTGAPIIADALGARYSYRKLILGAQILGRKLADETADGAAVGVLLPNTATVAVAFFALQGIGRVAAMLNYTAGAANMVAACRAAKIDVVVTSRAFIDKARLAEAVARLGEVARIVYLEDVKETISIADKVRGLVQGGRAQVVARPTDAAAILFTSGSEGTPKGVVLSHRNLLANAFQCLHRIAVNGEDKVFNVMPVFHSFGLTGGLIMPLTGGVPVYLYPSPLHYRIVPELVYGSNATILFGTDTFLTGYARAAHPYDFHRVRLIVSGAEAVKDRTRQTYMEKFGVRILEGYGVTETAPVLAINTPLANKSGTVGRLAPLMEARLEPVPGISDGGRLYVRGPNVMLGYMRTENPGVIEAPPDGWHDTGDIVAIDAQGFISIKGRAKRFAKIGGEMVSLSAVEALAAELWPQALSIVVSVPDARKGERLILMATDPALTREAFVRHARSKGVSELNVPAELLVVDKLPLLGSGKPDYVGALTLARERLAARPVKPEALVANALA